MAETTPTTMPQVSLSSTYVTGHYGFPSDPPKPERKVPKWLYSEGWLTSAARARRRRRDHR